MNMNICLTFIGSLSLIFLYTNTYLIYVLSIPNLLYHHYYAKLLLKVKEAKKILLSVIC